MADRYLIYLSRKDKALVSYFPGLEVRNRRRADWIETALLPALLPVARRQNKKISGVPITFWASIRETARPYREEIFLFTTPAFPGTTIEQALGKALETFEDGKVLAGREPIPSDAFPCCQVFRGKLVRFYYKTDDSEDCYYPAIKWRNEAPTFELAPVDGPKTLIENVDAEQIPIRAVVEDLMTGEHYRKFQQALTTIGIAEH